MDSFEKVFKDIVDKVSLNLENIISYFEKKSFISLINCLKYNDEMAVKDALNQLIDEGNKLAIAPIYLTSKKHPSFRVRNLCDEALGKLDDKQKIEKITQEKDLENAVEELIKVYGNYKYD